MQLVNRSLYLIFLLLCTSNHSSMFMSSGVENGCLGRAGRPLGLRTKEESKKRADIWAGLCSVTNVRPTSDL